jgi:hypothetical protein
MSKRIDVTQSSQTIGEIVKARNIQKAEVDQNKMIEEIVKFQKPVVEEVHKIVPAIEQSSKVNGLPIEASKILPQLELKTSLSLDPDKVYIWSLLIIKNTLNQVNY